MSQLLTLPNIDESIDLTGDRCPYTFVKSKLALEMMDSGQVLQVTVDNLESATNVPRSLTNEGNKVLDVAQTGGKWQIVVQKK